MRNTSSSVIAADFLPEHKRFEYWADVVNKSLNPIELDSTDRKSFDAKVEMYNVGEATYFLSRGKSPFSVHRTRQLIAQADSHPFHLIVRLIGGGEIKQGKREAKLCTGDVVLVDTKQVVVSTMENSHSILLSIPDVIIRAWIPKPEDCVAQPLQTHKGWAAVLMSYLRNLNPQIIDDAQHHQHGLMIEHLLSIYLFALEETGIIKKQDPLSASYQRTDLYVRMYNWLRENYMNPDLTAAQIAQHFGVSTREVHRQFSLTPERSTFLETLRAMRLTAAVRMLKDSNFSTLTISEIGYRSGFNDSVYFGRVFRKILNCSPGAFAKAHQNRERIETTSSITPLSPPNDSHQ